MDESRELFISRHHDIVYTSHIVNIPHFLRERIIS